MSTFTVTFVMMADMTDIRVFHLMNLALAAVISIVLYFDQRTAVQLMALTGVAWLTMLLVIPRLFYGTYFTRWKDQLERIAKLSKYVGLWVAAWFAAHGTVATLTYYGVPSDISHFVRTFELSQPIILAVLSLSVFSILVVISNKWSYAHVKWWKQLNMLVWMIPFMGIAHSLLAARTYLHEWPLLFITPVLLTIASLIGFDSLFAKERRYTDKLRIIYLVISAILTLLVVYAWPR